jgi:CelD/BcsL family acetyltransferase involved in cellulose biosynthesis
MRALLGGARHRAMGLRARLQVGDEVVAVSLLLQTGKHLHTHTHTCGK